MVQTIPFKGGDEHDALSRTSKRYHKFRSGARKAIKRGYNRRVRRLTRKEIMKDGH